MVRTTTLDSLYRNRNIPGWLAVVASVDLVIPTLLAGFVLSFSNIFCDWALVANAIAAQLLDSGMGALWDSDVSGSSR